MPTFAYQARDEAGRLVKGVFEADSRELLAERLRRMGYLVTRLDETAGRTREKPGWSLRWNSALSQEELLMTAVQLANLVEAGIPLVTTLRTISSQMPSSVLRTALEAVTEEIESGLSLSESLSRHPTVFPNAMVRLVAVGEASGRLDTVLSRFSNMAERDLTLKRAVVGALLYPCLLLAAALSLMVLMVTFVVPQFTPIFARAGVALPLPTRILQGVGFTLRAYGWLLGLLLMVGGFSLGILYRVPSVRLMVDRLLLRLPLVGPVIHQMTVARFVRTLGTLVGSGVPILNALETAKGVVENRIILQEIQRVSTAVERGERIAATLSVGKVFAPDAVQMIRVGEESGRLHGMLEKVADFYELRVGYRLKQMTTLFEPILLIVMGAIVAFILASLLLPMFDMVKTVRHGGAR